MPKPTIPWPSFWKAIRPGSWTFPKTAHKPATGPATGPVFLFIALLLAAWPGRAADLTVSVVGLRSADGMVKVALYDDPAAFPKSDGTLDGRTVPVTARGAQARFTDLAAGDYAVAVYHDENGNGAFDQGLLGIPLEGYGFSNGARAFLGPPDFAAARIRLGPDGAAITIKMDY